MNNYRDDAPQILCDFLSYHETIKAHSQKTVDEYFLDLRNFFRYMKQSRDRSLRDTPWDEISILDVDIDFIRAITLTDIYGYLTYLSRDRAQQQNSVRTEYGLSAATRARKIATLRSFFNYLTNKAHLLEDNPVKELDSPKLRKNLPKYLTLDESLELLASVDGPHKERDYCILTIFLNCGLRISELVGLNKTDIHGDQLRVLGKGNKERMLFLNDACQRAAGGTLNYIRFTSLPNASAGRLYMNYASPSRPGAPATTTANYTAGGGLFIGQLSFVPKAGYQGQVNIPYTGYNTQGGSFSGNVTIDLYTSYCATPFYDVDSGAIKVDGTDIRNITRGSLRTSYGMVLQETWLRAGTIRDNIRMGKPEASEEEVILAAKEAHAHSFIKRLPNGYDTVITEDGGSLSQGQKQLLCIARVMLCLPPMLILDEATSSIDTRTEIKIQNAFARMMEGRTSFIVAHRLSTIREADIILVMKDGNIIEQGNHETLLAQKGFYATLYNSQFAG